METGRRFWMGRCRITSAVILLLFAATHRKIFDWPHSLLQARGGFRGVQPACWLVFASQGIALLWLRQGMVTCTKRHNFKASVWR